MITATIFIHVVLNNSCRAKMQHASGWLLLFGLFLAPIEAAQGQRLVWTITHEQGDSAISSDCYSFNHLSCSGIYCTAVAAVCGHTGVQLVCSSDGGRTWRDLDP